MRELKKMLVTGASGFLGWNLCRAACRGFRVTGVSLKRPVAVQGIDQRQCDLTCSNEVEALFVSVEPDIVVHCAAMVNPNDCKERPEASRRINVDASLYIAEQCAKRGIRCVFISSDLLFDGRNPPYSEASEPCPISRYGEHKLEAEIGMRSLCPDFLVCRVPLMYGDVPPGASSCIQPMIAALREGREITLFTDEYRTPACGASAAEGILLALELARGIIHLGGRERISRFDFGIKLATALGIERPRIRGALQRQTAIIAPRPPDVSFNSTKAFNLGYAPFSIDEELRRLECIKDPR